MKKIQISPNPSINQALQKVLADSNWKPNFRSDSYWKNFFDDYFDDDDYDDDEDYSSTFLSQPSTLINDSYDEYEKRADTQLKDIFFYEEMASSADDLENTNYTERFNNINELKEFCDTNGINISKGELNNLRYRSVSHCTIDPLLESTGELSLISDFSKGGLYFDYKNLADKLAPAVKD